MSPGDPLVLAVAIAIADASDDGAFDEDRQDEDPGDRDHYKRLAAAAIAANAQFTPPADRARSAIYLETAALGYAEQVRFSMRCTTPPATEPWGASAIASFRGARELLSTTALSYAGAMGSLDAAQQAELRELRRFRDGVVDLRGEIADVRGPDHRVLSGVVETINALFTVHPLAAPSPQPQNPEEQP